MLCKRKLACERPRDELCDAVGPYWKWCGYKDIKLGQVKSSQGCVNLQTTRGHTPESRGRSPRCAVFTDKSDPGGALAAAQASALEV